METIGENLKHSSTETMIEISKLSDFLSNIVHVTQQVKNCQHHSTFTETKLTINNIVDSNPKLSSSVAQRNQHLSQLTISRKRPCIFRVKT
ncbi:unnamed protein product [Onchocerca flexuosa]|uniref:Ovule protein n=1 Tax=Onchocerca flexuosa TaxID=387005 RepID=A0A183H058_9BILA|nr:unnamed protein product [Onchocerca flexuosa]